MLVAQMAEMKALKSEVTSSDVMLVWRFMIICEIGSKVIKRE
jgi:hypothetical protein